MAQGKKSFKMYVDQRVFFDELPDELAGKVIKYLFSYVSDEDIPEDDLLLKIAFAPIKRQLKHDLKKYEEIVERNKKNGALGGRPKTQLNPKNPVGYSGLNKNPNKPDKDKDKDKDIEDMYKDKAIDGLYNKFVKEVKNGEHQISIESWYISLKIKKGSLTPLLEEFKGHLITINKLHPNTLEFRKHFKSWLDKLNAIGKLNEYKTKSKGAL